jgi:pimeloyl-ACP methyl ester carboxylesterase
VQKVKEELEKISKPVVLVGHSLAGFVVSQVAEEMPGKIEKLIFISSMVPYNQKTVYDIISEDAGSELLKNLIFAEDKSWATVNEDTLKNIVYNGATQEQIMNAAPHLVHQATQPFFVPVTTTVNRFGKIDKIFIVCEKDKILSAAAQKELAKIINCNKIISINMGHVPHVENPELLAETILKSE